MQTQFMGLRPDGWLEELAADKARQRRQKRVRIALGVLPLVCVILGLPAWV